MAKARAKRSGGKTPTGRATIRDVAAEAGVSVSSVSRTLNGGHYTSAELHARIMRSVNKLGFEPNDAARLLRSQTSTMIGCLVPDIANPLYAEIVNGAEEQLQAAGYQFVIGSTRHDEQREVALISALRRRRMDGVLIMAGESSHARTSKAIDGLDIPKVGIDRQLPDAAAACVDHRHGAVEATRYLIAMGHRRIALLMGSATMFPGAQRLEGYIQAHKDAGLAVDMGLVRPQRLSTSFAFSEVNQLLRSKRRPTAIITLGTHMLAGVMEALRTLDLRIPTDLSVVSVGDTDLARHATPAITALSWDLGELGRAAAMMLLQRIGSERPTEQSRIVLPTRLVVRDSCAPPSRRTSAL